MKKILLIIAFLALTTSVSATSKTQYYDLSSFSKTKISQVLMDSWSQFSDFMDDASLTENHSDFKSAYFFACSKAAIELRSCKKCKKTDIETILKRHVASMLDGIDSCGLEMDNFTETKIKSIYYKICNQNVKKIIKFINN